MMFSKMLCLICAALALVGCVAMPAPSNLADAQYQPSQALAASVAKACVEPGAPPLVATLQPMSLSDLEATQEVIAAGDRFKLQVSGDVDHLTASYVVSAQGALLIKGLGAVAAAGRPRAAVEADLRALMIAAGLLRDVEGNVSLVPLEAAGVPVSVEGAVFRPALVRAGGPVAGIPANPADPSLVNNFNAGRTLAAAILAAGGLRPDAAAHSVYLIRGERYLVLDLTPAFSGGVPPDPQLTAGDRIIVPSIGCFQASYVRPTHVTAPDIPVILSNLARPAGARPSSSDVPYGTRMLDGLVMAQCVGGSAMNAGRQAVLFSRNPMNGKSVVVARSIEAMVRSEQRDAFNPYLMPGDAIACYDSSMMALVDVVGVVGSLLSPAILVGIR